MQVSTVGKDKTLLKKCGFQGGRNRRAPLSDPTQQLTPEVGQRDVGLTAVPVSPLALLWSRISDHWRLSLAIAGFASWFRLGCTASSKARPRRSGQRHDVSQGSIAGIGDSRAAMMQTPTIRSLFAGA